MSYGTGDKKVKKKDEGEEQRSMRNDVESRINYAIEVNKCRKFWLE